MSLAQYVDAWQNKKILVVGDLCLDRWVHYRTSSRKNPESDQPIWEVESVTESLGMAGLVVAMVDALGGQSVVLQADSDPQSTKTRQWIDGKPLPRIDRDVKARPLRVRRVDQRVDCILVCDYAKGVVNRETVAWLASLGEHWQIPVIVDPARGEPLDKYCGVTAIKCNEQEWRTQRLDGTIRLEALITTLGEDGCHLSENVFLSGTGSGESSGSSVSFQRCPLDNANVIGAGDQFLAALGLAKAAGASWPDACRIANIAAGIKCRHERTEPCTLDELLAELPCHKPLETAR